MSPVESKPDGLFGVSSQNLDQVLLYKLVLEDVEHLCEPGLILPIDGPTSPQGIFKILFLKMKIRIKIK